MNLSFPAPGPRPLVPGPASASIASLGDKAGHTLFDRCARQFQLPVSHLQRSICVWIPTTGLESTMTPDALVRAWFHEVWDVGDESAIDRLMAADAKVHGLSGPDGPTVMIGPAHFKPF